MLGEACSRQCALLVKSFNPNVSLILCSESFHDLCCMSCHPPPPLVFGVTHHCVPSNEAEKSEALEQSGQKPLELFSVWLQAADRQWVMETGIPACTHTGTHTKTNPPPHAACPPRHNKVSTEQRENLQIQSHSVSFVFFLLSYLSLSFCLNSF